MYERFYKLSDRPFQLTPDPRFFYASQGHRKALAFLRYGVQQGEGFVVITGGVGTGKTTLAQTFLEELKDQNIATASVVTTQLEDEDMIRSVAAAFGLPFQRLDKVSLLKNLENFFRDCVRQRKRVLLVVDEAQNLPARSIEELRMLSNFQFQGKPLVQTFMLGQSQLRKRISSIEFEQLRQRITAVHHLDSLNVNETKEYIEHRLRCVGWLDDPSISNAALLAIHEATTGVPRRINNVCERVLLYGFLEGLHHLDEQAVNAVVKELKDEYGEIGERDDVNPAAPFERTADDPGQGQLVAGQADLGQLTSAVRELTAMLREELGALRAALLPAGDTQAAAPVVLAVAQNLEHKADTPNGAGGVPSSDQRSADPLPADQLSTDQLSTDQQREVSAPVLPPRLHIAE